MSKPFTITRVIDGVEHHIVLSSTEMERVYRLKDEAYRIEDIKSKLLEMICDEEGVDDYENDGLLPDVSESTTAYSKALREMYNSPETYYDHVEKALSNNDGYWDSFWTTITYCLEEDAKAEMK